MRRRLDLAVSLVATPPVLFLDEPTTGLDPRSRVELWDVLRELVRDGTTLLLTTQYLEEADQLADNIVVIDKGKLIAEGTPLELKDQSGRAALVVTVSHADDLERAADLLRPLVPEVHLDHSGRTLTAPAEGLGEVSRAAQLFDSSDIELDDLGLQRPSLDDVFLHLTGHRAEDHRPSRRKRCMSIDLHLAPRPAPRAPRDPADQPADASRSRSSGATSSTSSGCPRC